MLEILRTVQSNQDNTQTENLSQRTYDELFGTRIQRLEQRLRSSAPLSEQCEYYDITGRRVDPSELDPDQRHFVRRINERGDYEWNMYLTRTDAQNNQPLLRDLFSYSTDGQVFTERRQLFYGTASEPHLTTETSIDRNSRQVRFRTLAQDQEQSITLSSTGTPIDFQLRSGSQRVAFTFQALGQISGLQISATTAEGQQQTLRLDAQGKPLTFEVKQGDQTTLFTFDQSGRIQSMIRNGLDVTNELGANETALDVLRRLPSNESLLGRLLRENSNGDVALSQLATELTAAAYRSLHLLQSENRFTARPGLDIVFGGGTRNSPQPQPELLGPPRSEAAPAGGPQPQPSAELLGPPRPEAAPAGGPQPQQPAELLGPPRPEAAPAGDGQRTPMLVGPPRPEVTLVATNIAHPKQLGSPTAD